MQCGAHLFGSARVIGEKMCTAAAAGDLKRLTSYYLANADLSQKDFSGRAPMHFAVLNNKIQSLKFLLEHGADAKCFDKTGQSPYDLAKALDSAEITTLLSPPDSSSVPVTVKTMR